MITVHHLNNSRSQRILWLLEEPGLDYQVSVYTREPQTMRAPPAMAIHHPLGKAPLFEDDGTTIAESGAIVDYILSRYGDGRLMPASDNWPDRMMYLQWCHIAISLGMTPLLLRAYQALAGSGSGTLEAIARVELDKILDYVEQSLGNKSWIMGERFTAADIQLSFVPELARVLLPSDRRPNIERWLRQCHDRPAFIRSVARGGPYDFA